jgi:hypothetical protein
MQLGYQLTDLCHQWADIGRPRTKPDFSYVMTNPQLLC